VSEQELKAKLKKKEKERKREGEEKRKKEEDKGDADAESSHAEGEKKDDKQVVASVSHRAYSFITMYYSSLIKACSHLEDYEFLMRMEQIYLVNLH
jgi:hypothetical protein